MTSGSHSREAAAAVARGSHCRKQSMAGEESGKVAGNPLSDSTLALLLQRQAILKARLMMVLSKCF